MTEGDDNDESDWIVADRSGKRRPVARMTELDGGSSPISRLFSGVLLNRSTVNHAKHAATRGSTGSSSRPISVDVLARNATHVSVKEPFFILPLEINNSKIVSIESALLCLSDREEVSDYRDSLTGMASTLRRHAYLDQLPPFFIFQLKRFTVIAPGDSLGKSLKFIPIEQELRIPKKLLSGEKQFSLDQRIYRLQGVIFHVGHTPHSGHYTVAVRCSPELLTQVLSKHPFNVRESITRSPVTFLYLDDTHGCLVPDGVPLKNLLSSHRPLDAHTGQFTSLPQNSTISPTDRPSIRHQPRTPYVLVYESVLSSRRES
ncbi:hypothetical protein FBUS_08215 [Fasciolopsis buskii]|uniref:ubiquitinyl hydrolase 1 n=1 Tax=Fasciolopsis buskii TaxID=27845 RepID=A0A8E0S0S4_9TREM|nr:hypothetical protein FBUS_08215 [Fasciolopsis buski]